MPGKAAEKPVAGGERRELVWVYARCGSGRVVSLPSVAKVARAPLFLGELRSVGGDTRWRRDVHANDT